MHYWSRSRQKFWLKGETSGHTQKVLRWAADCDADTLLFEVEQIGGACHTGYESCFFQTPECGRNAGGNRGNASSSIPRKPTRKPMSATLLKPSRAEFRELANAGI